MPSSRLDAGRPPEVASLVDDMEALEALERDMGLRDGPSTDVVRARPAVRTASPSRGAVGHPRPVRREERKRGWFVRLARPREGRVLPDCLRSASPETLRIFAKREHLLSGVRYDASVGTYLLVPTPDGRMLVEFVGTGNLGEMSARFALARRGERAEAGPGPDAPWTPVAGHDSFAWMGSDRFNAGRPSDALVAAGLAEDLASEVVAYAVGGAIALEEECPERLAAFALLAVAEAHAVAEVGNPVLDGLKASMEEEIRRLEENIAPKGRRRVRKT